MTIGELIDRLSKYPAGTEVRDHDGEDKITIIRVERWMGEDNEFNPRIFVG